MIFGPNQIDPLHTMIFPKLSLVLLFRVDGLPLNRGEW